jgi:electron-transferring-flavoprotein dehydrogenase
MMEADIVCVGFGPATGGFLTTLARGLVNADGTPIAESRVAPGLPPQIICFERADDISFGVSGVVTRARGIRSSFSDLDIGQIPMAAPVTAERMIYLLDPIGASRRSTALRVADALIRAFKRMLPYEKDAVRLPFVPRFLRKEGGLLLSIGQFMQWVGGQILSSGTVQVWPSTPVASPLVEDGRVVGVRLVDQGIDQRGNPDEGYMPGMDVRAELTVVGDGPVGPIGRRLDERFGVPPGLARHDWAIGMKMVVELAEDADVAPGSVLHTFGYPEPEIFGFMYVYPDRIASLGIFVPSWLQSPVRTGYRYLQHWMQHPYLWRHLRGGTLRSWGAKSLQESGRRGEPYLVGDGYARVGEGAGSTNVLTGSGVDEAWTTGMQLAEAVVELLKDGRPFTKENLEATYVARRRASWVERDGRVAENARNGFHHGVVTGLVGMALAGLTGGRWSIRPPAKGAATEGVPSLEEYYRGRIGAEEIDAIRRDCTARGISVHDAVMERAGWPTIPYDGRLLLTHQDALLVGGKVQAPPSYADHVVFLYPEVCEDCGTRLCVEMCSGAAITPGEDGVPLFDRDKCVHCGACFWNCTHPIEGKPGKTNIEFRAGAGGLHSGEN